MVSKAAVAAAIQAGREHPSEDVMNVISTYPEGLWSRLEAMWHLGMLDAANIVADLEDDEPISNARVIPSRNSDPATSHAAGSAVRMRAGTQRARLLEGFGHMHDATDEEAMLWAGISPQSEYSKRCSELREAGFILSTGDTRPGQSGNQRIVSRITWAGRVWLQANVK